MKRSDLLKTLPILGVMVVGDGPTRTEALERETARATQVEARSKPKRKRWVIVHVWESPGKMPSWHLAGDECGLCDGAVGRPAITWYDGDLPYRPPS